MNKIIVDLYAFNPNYFGGVSRFSIGLIKGLIKNLGANNVDLIVSDDNADMIRKLFDKTNLHVKKKRLFERYILIIFSVFAWIFNSTRLYIYLTKKYNPLTNDIGNCSVIVPTSTINFYNIECAILCIHDIQHEVHPNNFTILQKAIRWARYRSSTEHATYIQVSSNYVALTLRKCYGDSFSSKTFLAGEGFDPEEFGSFLSKDVPFELLDKNIKFIYYPAQLWKHKNHQIVIKGLFLFNQNNSANIHLVLTGKNYGEFDSIHDACVENNITLHYLGLVSDAEMRWLYANSICTIAAGYHESSSLPLREAIACRSLVLAADIPPNIDVSYIPSVRIFNAFSSQSFCGELLKIINVLKSTEYISMLNTSADLISQFEWKYISKIYINKLS